MDFYTLTQSLAVIIGSSRRWEISSNGYWNYFLIESQFKIKIYIVSSSFGNCHLFAQLAFRKNAETLQTQKLFSYTHKATVIYLPTLLTFSALQSFSISLAIGAAFTR